MARIWRAVALAGSNLLVAAAFGGVLTGAALADGEGKIAFDSNRDGPPEIYVMEADGSQQTRITSNAFSDSSPTWSPDASKLAFASNRDGNLEIYVMGADGSQQNRLTSNPGPIDDLPAWSPDGARIAFMSNRDGNMEIYVMGTDGSQQTRLTFDPSSDYAPAWSPDGRRIAFHRGDGPGGAEIYVMNADGSGQIRLTTNAFADREPAWSPDGTRIAFVSDRDLNPEIFAMNADGSSPTQLTSTAPSTDNILPDWSPDGKEIAFRTNRDGNNEIYVMQADGSGLKNRSRSASSDSNPDWVLPPTPSPVVAPAADSTAPEITSLSIEKRFAPTHKSTPVGLATSGAAGAERAKRAAPRGATIRFSLSEAATVRFKIVRQVRGLTSDADDPGSADEASRCVSAGSRNTSERTRQIRRGLRGKRLSHRQRLRRIRRALRAASCTLYKQRGEFERQGSQGDNSVPFSGRIGTFRLTPGIHRIVATALDATGNVSTPVKRRFRIVRSR